MRNISLNIKMTTRDAKITMERQNMKSLFENIEELEGYLYKMASTFSPCTGEHIYLKTLGLLKNKQIAMDDVFAEIGKIYNKLDAEYFEFILDKIVHDYNDFFLNDEFYYNGYWHDEEWISTK
jgi:hypothetical protein